MSTECEGQDNISSVVGNDSENVIVGKNIRSAQGGQGGMFPVQVEEEVQRLVLERLEVVEGMAVIH